MTYRQVRRSTEELFKRLGVRLDPDVARRLQAGESTPI